MNELKEPLLKHLWEEIDDAQLISCDIAREKHSWVMRLVERLCLGLLLCASLIGNVFLFKEFSRVNNMHLYQRKGGLSGLPYDTPMVYSTSTAWSSTNETIADSAWESIDTSPVTVALSDGYALEQGFPRASRFPWAEDVGMYHVKAFHHMHCLKNIRRAYMDLKFNREPVVAYSHFMHCLDSLRQDLMCLADDTLMPGHPTLSHHIGDGQVLQCRDWDKLVAWTQEPQRSACFTMLSDYRPVPNTIEEFSDCPPGSPYAEIAKTYFEEHGHRDPWTGNDVVVDRQESY